MRLTATTRQEITEDAHPMRHAFAQLSYKMVVLAVVIVPLVATVLAIVLLWQRAVHWSDLVLLGTMYVLRRA